MDEQEDFFEEEEIKFRQRVKQFGNELGVYAVCSY